MTQLLPRLGLGLLLASAASPLLAQTVTDTTRTPAPAPIPTATPAPLPVAPTVTPAAAAPARIDVTDPKAPLQAPVYVPLDHDVYRLIDRYAIKYGPDSAGDVHTSTKPYNRGAVARLAARLGAGPQSKADAFNRAYLLQDNWQFVTDPANQALSVSRQPVLKHFYRTPTDLYSVNTKDFQLRVNPVIHFQAGPGDAFGLLYTNTRGVQVEGTIDQRLGFFTYFTDTQTRVPGYVGGRVLRDNAFPHEGYWKLYKDQTNQYDFLTARGYVTYAATKHINVQLGHDRNFIGNGYRSLILSDFAAPYFFLKLNTRVWKLNYQNIFAELTTERTRDPRRGNIDTVFQKKYMALHHLSYDITPSLNVGLFETVMFGRRKGRFELQYLNPIIFYRSVEQAIGSDDNAILGADFRWNIKKRGQIYGQVVLDELIVSQVRAGNGWWSNKQAFQIGGKYIDVFGLNNLDLQLEYNYIRPYTYQHEDLYRAYEHYGQPLAHPMGANLWEVFGQLSYQPLPRLTLLGKGFFTKFGRDIVNSSGTTLNYGGNPLLSYNTRVQEYGNEVGQGQRSNLMLADFTATWQLRPNLWLDGTLLARAVEEQYSNGASSRTTNFYPSVSLRWNAARRLYEF
jgi:hypothetical protein